MGERGKESERLRECVCVRSSSIAVGLWAKKIICFPSFSSVENYAYAKNSVVNVQNI